MLESGNYGSEAHAPEFLMSFTIVYWVDQARVAILSFSLVRKLGLWVVTDRAESDPASLVPALILAWDSPLPRF